jgi:HTH-type transcriptional regulator/antitoxin HigA
MEPIRPLRSAADYEAAIAEIRSLWAAKPGTPEHDRLEVLGILVEAYQDEHVPIDHPDPVEAIKFVMEQNGKSRADLAKIVGSSARAAEILRRRRPLTLALVRALEREWGIPASLLVQPYRRDKRAA